MKVYGAILLIVGFGLAGCGLLPHVDQPGVVVRSVTLADQSEHGARVLVAIELTNPNDVPLPLIDAQYTLTLRPPSGGGVTYEDLPNRTLPASGLQVITLPAGLRSEGTLRGSSYLITGSVSYEPPGEIRKLLTEAGIPLPSVAFSGTGNLP